MKLERVSVDFGADVLFKKADQKLQEHYGISIGRYRHWRIVLPAYSNEVIMILKSTSLASTITLLDLLGVTRHLVSLTYQVLPFFLAAGCLYLILNSVIIGIFKILEKKYMT